MTTELDALLAAVIANPADDLPRCLYADKCRELGDEDRADFIETQLELARLPDCGHRPGRDVAWWAKGVTCPRCRLWQASERFLMSDAAKPVRQLPWGSAPRHAVGRGFVESVTRTAEQWIQHGDAIRAKHPVERVTLTTWPRFYCHQNLQDRAYGLSFSLPDRIVTDRITEQALAATQSYAGAIELIRRTINGMLAEKWEGVKFSVPRAMDARWYAELRGEQLREFQHLRRRLGELTIA